MPAKKVVKKSVKKVQRKTITKEPANNNVLIGLIIGLLIVGGLFVYNATKTVPAGIEVMEVSQPSSFSFNETFGNGLIDAGKWKVTKSDDVTVTETTGDNLRIVVPAGAVAGKSRNGKLMYKETVSQGKNFSYSARLYKPIVTGAGMGRTSVRFVDNNKTDAEGASISWEVSGGTSQLVYRVNIGGSITESSVAVVGNSAQVVLKRAGNEYSASYRMNSFDDDTAFETLGEAVTSTAVNGGRLTLGVENTGVGGFPRVVGRVDNVILTSNLTSSNVFSDNFASIDSGKWSANAKGGSAQSIANGNLVMNVPAGTTPAARNKFLNVSSASITADKRAVAIVEMFKPKATGAGTAISGIGFSSTGTVDDEGASIRWEVNGASSKLVFVVKNAQGKVEEKASVDISGNRNRLTAKLVHADGGYIAMYRLGAGLDDDSGFVKLGAERDPKLGAAGQYSLFATHASTSGVKAPAVVTKFDSFRISYQ